MCHRTCQRRRRIDEMELMMNSLERLVGRWHGEGVDAFPPYGESIIRATYLQVGVEPAKDLLKLYRTIGGMEMCDNAFWRLWPLSEVDARNSEANSFGVLFSDYMLDCWAYRVKPNDENTSSVYVDYFDERDPIRVAHSLAEFFDRYIENAERLLEGD